MTAALAAAELLLASLQRNPHLRLAFVLHKASDIEIVASWPLQLHSVKTPQMSMDIIKQVEHRSNIILLSTNSKTCSEMYMNNSFCKS